MLALDMDAALYLTCASAPVTGKEAIAEIVSSDVKLTLYS